MPDFSIEGNPGAVRSRAATIRTKGELFSHTGDALARVTTDGWTSRAATMFREKFDAEPGRWHDAGGDWQRAATALDTWADALEDAQRRADWARGEYARGEQVTRDARAAYDADVARARAEAASKEAAGITVNLTILPFEDPGEPVRQGALDEYAAAKADLDTAAHSCAAGIRAGCAHAPEKRNWLEKAGGAVAGFFQGAGEALLDLGKLAAFLTMPEVVIPMMLISDLTNGLTPEEIAAKYRLKAEDAVNIAKFAAENPLEFGKTLGKAILDWDTWADDPARAAGHLLPDAIIAVLTAGSGTLATRGAKAMTDGLRGLTKLDDLTALTKLDNLGEMGRVYDTFDGATHLTRFAPEQLPDAADLGRALDSVGWTRQELIEKINTPVSELSAADRVALNHVRDAVPPPDAGTVMQKVITPDQYDRYMLDPHPPEIFSPDSIGGSVTRAGDSAHLGTPDSLRDGLRLDYPGSPFQPGDHSVHVIRFTTDGHFEAPRHTDLGGPGRYDAWDQPFTGNGFTKADDAIVPEWQPVAGEPVPMNPGAEMWEVLDDGTQRLVGVLKGGEWVPVG